MNKFLYFLLFTFGISCIQNVPDYSIEASLRKFDPKLVSHFPQNSKDLISDYFSFPDSQISLNMGASLYGTYKVKNIDSLINFYASHSKKITFHRDSCNLILPIRNYRNHKIGKYILSECSNALKIMPIPNFLQTLYELEPIYDMKLDDTRFLPDDIIIMILDAKKGKFLSNNNLLKENTMPPDWQHGFTRGIMINKIRKEVTYWCEIW